jgi:KipI family sensor histidine kinase inhibitor
MGEIGREIQSSGDSALLIRWPGQEATLANRRSRAIAAKLTASPPPGLADCVVASRSLLVTFDPLVFDRAAFLRLVPFWERDFAQLPKPRRHEIPVCYGGSAGVDLEELAAERGLSAGQFVERQAAETYTVSFVGFSPGFAYLNGLPPLLSAPRLSTPRTSVPWGSLAIGGNWAGIYPSSTSGGWRLIGRTPIVLFDPASDSPALLSPGDEVRFVPIEEWKFSALAGRIGRRT